VPTKRARFGFRGRFAVVRSNLQFTPTERLRLRRLCPAPGFGRDVRDLARWYRECSDDVASYSESPREAELALRALHADVLAIDRKPASLPARVRFMERFGSLSATAEAFLKVGLYSVGLYGAPLTDLGAVDAAMRAAWAAGLAAGADAAASEKGRHVQRGAHLERGIARQLAAIFAEYGVRFTVANYGPETAAVKILDFVMPGNARDTLVRHALYAIRSRRTRPSGEGRKRTKSKSTKPPLALEQFWPMPRGKV
jgi:hypothetical protein